MSQSQNKSKAKQLADEAVDRSSNARSTNILRRLIPGIDKREEVPSNIEAPPTIEAPSNTEAPTITEAPLKTVAPPKSKGQPLQIEAAPKTVAPPKSERGAGFLRVTNELIDDILPTLRPSEQVVLLRLYRLTRGFGEDICTVSIGTLASRCHLKPSQTRTCLKELERKKHIKRLGTDLSNPVQDLRGVTFQVFVEGIAPSKSVGGSNSGGPSKFETNKEKDLKENTKGESAPPDYKNCPDCNGSGFWYPEGIEKGVAKCKHVKLVSRAN